jgi:hypothetical protein
VLSRTRSIERAEPPPADAPATLAERLRNALTAIRPIYAFSVGYEGTQRQLVYDLEVAVRILDLPEFADWLRVHGDDTQSRFGTEIAELVDRDNANAEWGDDVEQALKAAGCDLTTATAPEIIGELADQAEQARQIRAVLVEVGALSADDTATSVPDLLRALVS